MKNKSFSIVCIFLLIVLLFTSNVFAVSLNDNNNKTYNLPEFTDEMKQYDKYLIFVEEGGKLFNLYFLVDNDGYFFNNGSGAYYHGRAYLCSTRGDGFFNCRYQGATGENLRFGGSITGSSVFICNNNIYTDVDKSDVFFSSVSTGTGSGSGAGTEEDNKGNSGSSSIDFSSGGVFSWIAQGFELVIDTIKALLNPVELLTKYLNPLSEDFIFTRVFNHISSLFDFLDPTGEKFIFTNLFKNVSNILSYI